MTLNEARVDSDIQENRPTVQLSEHDIENFIGRLMLRNLLEQKILKEELDYYQKVISQAKP